MRALLLAAGFGTRLRPLTSTQAKPAIPVAGEPIIRRIIRWLVSHEIRDLVINLHYLPHTVTAIVGDGSELGATVRYSWEHPEILGSGGGPRQALDILGDDTFLVVNGDTLTDLHLGDLIRAHDATDALVTLALVRKREPDKYGGVVLAGDGAVTGFVPRERAAADSYHFIGVQVARADAFRRLPPGRPARSTGGLYETLIAERRGAVRGFVSDAAFWDIGTLDDYRRTDAEFERREATRGRREDSRT
jgi:mannose-1-phosphate guanylyltransferase/phosphomannomutase